MLIIVVSETTAADSTAERKLKCGMLKFVNDGDADKHKNDTQPAKVSLL